MQTWLQLCKLIVLSRFNVVVFAGELIAPFIGGVLTKQYSFETACMILGFILLLISVLYVPVLCMSKIDQKRDK